MNERLTWLLRQSATPCCPIGFHLPPCLCRARPEEGLPTFTGRNHWPLDRARRLDGSTARRPVVGNGRLIHVRILLYKIEERHAEPAHRVRNNEYDD
jgi:hypothetical protein